ncbi:MAG: glycoside hydrolase family 99-like domain-containing protein, partial [Candidatus Sumerlaeota bacterium]|nr:glycoside hydrolase family 99-like domain-containing protein [Candidatus Sumerlaeota bacterium]
ARARPLFEDHAQPHLPTDLGFYDLRVRETRLAQTELAREYGIEGFCYWHYWFAGKLLLQRPLEEMRRSGRPEFPFCIGWANESWEGTGHGAPERTLIEQTYPGEADHVAHFNYLLPYFRDPRYVKVEGRPLFVLFRPDQIPDPKIFVDLFNRLAREAGFPGLHCVCYRPFGSPRARDYGFDAAVWAEHNALKRLLPKSAAQRAICKVLKRPLLVYDYEKVIPYLDGPTPLTDEDYPSLVPGWDNSARCGLEATILANFTPEAWRKQIRRVYSKVMHRPLERRLVFVKAWNEWAEGNYLEPDLRYGTAFLKVLKAETL